MRFAYRQVRSARRGKRWGEVILHPGPGAFVVLKALAFKGRGENKDAYDLYHLVRNFGEGVEKDDQVPAAKGMPSIW